MTTKTITLGGGCFWCIEASYRRLRGVKSAISGYSGGNVDNPTYEMVKSGTTNHAEVVQLEYEPDVISTEQILHVYFFLHNPTHLNRQGDEDVGTQYRSVVFYHDEEQREIARRLIRELDDSETYSSPVCTQVLPFEKFFAAENYHQNYFNENPQNQYCQRVVKPKVEKFLKTYDYLLKN